MRSVPTQTGKIEQTAISRSYQDSIASSASAYLRESIVDLQKMAVAEWLQSFNSVRGPIETLEIM